MGVELPAIKTPITIPALANCLIVRWEEMLGRTPTRRAVRLQCAHLKGEVGLTPIAYNLGNIKATRLGPGGWTGDYTYYTCQENVTQAQLSALLAGTQSQLIRVQRTWTDAAGKAMASIVVSPKHPWARFRAFSELAGGVDSQLRWLAAEGHEKCLAALETGDVTQYAHELHEAGYYTATESAYTKLVGDCLRDVERALPDDWNNECAEEWRGWGNVL